MLRSINSSRARKLHQAFIYKGWEEKDVFSVVGENIIRQAVNDAL